MATAKIGVDHALPVASARSLLPEMLVADDSPTALYAITCLLEHYRIATVVGRAQTVSAIMDAVARHQPEYLLLDAEMPSMSGLRTTLVLSQMYPEMKIILMSMDTSLYFRNACIYSGAFAFINKSKFLSELGKLIPGQAEAAEAPEQPA
jgi:DNA-binding NarL/FixJ family response regulator